jgi:hypothetical protein
MQIGLSIVTTDTFFAQLAFDLQMVRICNPTDTLLSHLQEELSGDNSFIPWHGGNRVKATNTVNIVNKLVTVFAAPYLDKLINAWTLQTSNNLHHRTAIPKPAARDFANTAPYLAAHRDSSLLNDRDNQPVDYAR